jgi:hypothetical protein
MTSTVVWRAPPTRAASEHLLHHTCPRGSVSPAYLEDRFFLSAPTQDREVHAGEHERKPIDPIETTQEGAAMATTTAQEGRTHRVPAPGIGGGNRDPPTGRRRRRQGRGSAASARPGATLACCPGWPAARRRRPPPWPACAGSAP